MRKYNTSCGDCGGMIFEPFKSYSYSGMVCHCLRPQPVWRGPAPIKENPLFTQQPQPSWSDCG